MFLDQNKIEGSENKNSQEIEQGRNSIGASEKVDLSRTESPKKSPAEQEIQQVQEDLKLAEVLESVKLDQQAEIAQADKTEAESQNTLHQKVLEKLINNADNMTADSGKARELLGYATEIDDTSQPAAP